MDFVRLSEITFFCVYSKVKMTEGAAASRQCLISEETGSWQEDMLLSLCGFLAMERRVG